MLGAPLRIGPQKTFKLRTLNKGPQPPSVLTSLWIDLRGRVVNLSFVFRAPGTKHIIGVLYTKAVATLHYGVEEYSII